MSKRSYYTLPADVRASVKERFFAHVSRGARDECWSWTASSNSTGYGQIAVAGTKFRAHRLAYELHRGPIRAGLLVLHRCDNPLCVNPAHLFLGTNADNMRDMVTKGRGRKERLERKLTAEQVREIRARFKNGESTNSLAAEFGVSGSNITHITQRRSWKWLDDESEVA